jgi:hypothetical protein
MEFNVPGYIYFRFHVDLLKRAEDDSFPSQIRDDIQLPPCHGSSLDLTLGHVTIDIRVEGAILVHSEGAILVHSEGTSDTLGRSHPSFTRLTLG